MTDNYDEQDFDNAKDLTDSRRRFFRRPRKTGDILAALMARKGYAQTQSSSELLDAWDQTVGETWINRTRPGNISRGVLEVVVASAAVHQQLIFRKAQLLSDMQQKLPQNKIKDIRFRTGRVTR